MSKKTSILCMAGANVYFVLTLVIGLLMVSGFLKKDGLKTAHAHIGLLGWISLTIMGAMYEQLPTLTAADLHSKKLAWWSFWVYNAGLVGLVAGMASESYGTLAAVSGSVLLLGVLAFGYNMAMTWRNRRAPNPIVKFYMATVVYFVLTSLTGAVMVLNKMGIIDLIDLFGPARYVTAHAHLGLLGWISLIIIGAMAWMFPMVLMKDIYSHRLMEAVFWVFNIGLIGFFIGLATGGLSTLTLASAAVVFLGVLIFIYDMVRTYLKQGMKTTVAPPKSTEAPFFYAAIGYFLLVGILGFLMVLQPGTIGTVSQTHAHLALLGFVSLTIFGGMYHLVPMLTWTLISRKMASMTPEVRAAMPRSLHDLYSGKMAEGIFYFFNIGIIGLALGMYLNLMGVARAGGLVVLVVGTAFSIEMFSVIKKGL